MRRHRERLTKVLSDAVERDPELLGRLLGATIAIEALPACKHCGGRNGYHGVLCPVPPLPRKP